jgi:hypothetical protein
MTTGVSHKLEHGDPTNVHILKKKKKKKKEKERKKEKKSFLPPSAVNCNLQHEIHLLHLSQQFVWLDLVQVTPIVVS